MFHIFSGNKPKLSDLIPAGFTDIHSHVLPNIDDGCKNMKESISLINEIKNFGISKIYATPHTYPGLYDNTNIGIINSYKELSKENKNDIIINYASEYLLDPSLIYKAKEKTLLTLKNNYVLVEMSFFSAPNMLHEILFEIQINGYKPILAHPERYRFLFNDINNYYKLKNLGCSFQINLFSLTGYYGGHCDGRGNSPTGYGMRAGSERPRTRNGKRS